jgi:co-chaperonin GroES (HSP10)
MMLRPLSDWVLVELLPERERAVGAIVRVGSDPIRLGRVLRAGPGRRLKGGALVAMGLVPGERIAFFRAVSETAEGRAIATELSDSEALIRERDVLLVIEEGEVEVTL